MSDRPVMVITGARKGIGRHLAEHYAAGDYFVVGCSRGESDLEGPSYAHFRLDVADEAEVVKMFHQIARRWGRVDVLLNNAGIASMNHFMLTPGKTVRKVLDTNVLGTFIFCREAVKLMARRRFGRIVNFTSIAVPMDLEGEAIYAASKAAVASLTRILARETAELGVTVNAVGPTAIRTDLTRGVPEEKLQALVNRQAIRRFGTFDDVRNVIDFFLKPKSDFVTGQLIYLGGV